jgi:phosphoribosylaminoimidazole-succinocarboxamide synthase
MGHEYIEVIMVNIDNLETGQFKELPLVIEGESKEVRYAGEGQVVIRLKPTIYSYTHNRAGEIPGSEVVRLQTIQRLLPCLRQLGIVHTYQQVNDNWILSELVRQPDLYDGPLGFRPDDLDRSDFDRLPKAPPIEVIAKARHTGTSKHRYFNFSKYPTRSGEYIGCEEAYPEPIIRFDWRNPMNNPDSGERLADEILPEPMAEWFIDTARAQVTAAKAFAGLSAHMRERNMDLWDICFFISEDGEKMFGEISPDCMRIRGLVDQALDKDVWRAGGSSDEVLKKWQTMLSMLDDTMALS